jgi:hypothetical protein
MPSVGYITYTLFRLCRVSMLSVFYAKRRYAECHYTEYRYVKCHYIKYRYVECRYAE